MTGKERRPPARLLKGMAAMLALSITLLFAPALAGCGAPQPPAQDPPEQGTGATDEGGAQPEAVVTPVPIAEENRITAEEVHQGLRDKRAWTVVDLRDYSKYVVAHVPGAEALPFRYVEKRMKEIPREQELVLVFIDPKEAQATWDILIANGYDPALIHIMDDGLDAWVAAGYETEAKAATRC